MNRNGGNLTSEPALKEFSSMCFEKKENNPRRTVQCVRRNDQQTKQ